MPIQRCRINGKKGWRYGQQGKCYTGPNGRAKAEKQAAAIRASGYTENEDGELVGVCGVGCNGVVGNQRVVRPAANPLRTDPTRTALLRKKFEREFSKRFARLRSRIIDLIEREDALGLRDTLVGNTRWRFRSDPEKIKAFADWLENQIVLGLIPLPANQMDDAYWQAYVEEGYRRGAGRAFDDVRKAEKATAKLDFYKGTKQQFLRSAFGRPESIAKVKLLASRVFTDLKGVTSDMSTKMSRALTDGLVQGKNPRAIARDLTDVVDISRNRANVIARTEIIRAHSEGALDAMEELGVTEVGVAVEWSTTDNPCPICAPLNGIILTVKEAHGMFPRHPNCKCSPIPANVGESTEAQLRTKGRITKAIERSLKAEAPKGRSVKQQKRKSTWAGAGKSIAKKRPKGIV